jgi:hypothetical protein
MTAYFVRLPYKASEIHIVVKLAPRVSTTLFKSNRRSCSLFLAPRVRLVRLSVSWVFKQALGLLPLPVVKINASG